MENNLENTWKYIVYETTNLINNHIYIGVHQTKDPNKFDSYLGCGVIATQPYTYQHAKTAFQWAVKKYGPKNFVRKTLAVFDTEDEAYLLEEQLVSEEFLARNDVYNMVLGGRGGILVQNKIKVYQYDEFGKYLAEYDSFADAGLKINRDYTLISYAVRKKCKAANCFWNTDKVDQLDLSQYNIGDNHRVKISCYLKTGEFYKTFDSQTQCANELQLSASLIRKACLLGMCVQNKYYFSYICSDAYDKANTEYIKIRSVHKYNGNTGEYICSYVSQSEAEFENKGSNISKSIKLKSQDKNGFLWSIEKLNNYNIPVNKNKKRKVGKFNLQNELIKTYESATAAANENGTSVWKVLNGTNQTHKQHYYKYL